MEGAKVVWLTRLEMAQRIWRHDNQPSHKIQAGFKSIQIYKNQILGVGSYGKVCKAKCDDLYCAAKMLHLALFDQDGPNFRRLHQEHEFLSTLRHPNIVQYISMYRAPDTRLPVLLMELMDENLTQYLELSSQPVPYHLQVNICHDVALALSFIHANYIVHRDVTGNNILITGNARVTKVSDFGISAFYVSDRKDLSICTGGVYMPPEAVSSDPKYTEESDRFSFGVVVIQILTREFPQPGNQKRNIYNPSGKYGIVLNVPEIERRQNHISKIDPSHPLLSIALDCLQDNDLRRPTAHQLCERIAALKETTQYTESKKSTFVSEEEITDLHRQLPTERQRSVLEQNREEIHRLREEIKQKEILVEEVFENARREQRLAVERELQNERRQIFQLEQQLVENQEETRRIERELTQQLRQEQQQLSQRERELTQARQQLSDVEQQIRTEQQRASRERDQLREKDEHIRELEHRLQQSEVEALGPRVTQLQLLPQGDSWNVPRREIQITKQIGYGAAGLVSKGRYQGQEVAVKQIHREILREKLIMDEFKREVGIMATIQHPNLVRFIAAVFDERVEQLRETPLLVLELLHTNLRDAYKDYNLGLSKCVSIFHDVAYGLHYLHEHSEPIIHRDVSAPNILLESLPGDMWRAKLSDFGSANFLKRAKTLGVGAIVYTAPEMFPREGPSAPMPRPTTKCDVFSYGIVLVEVITKTMPTTENRHQLFGEVERKWRLMYDLISQCTEVSPHARPTMAEVLNTLNRIPTARPR